MREQLLLILETLQPYAPWHLDTLRSASERYKEILLRVPARKLQRTDLDFLLGNLEVIERSIADAQERKVPGPYNTAMNMLRYDIEVLLQTC